MNELTVLEQNGVEVVDSRDVAEMVDKPHNDLMKAIRGYAENLNAGNFSLVDFFIPHSYTDSKGETRPCYLLTKKGCDMVANKMTGEKGVLFTAAYVTAFERMRKSQTASLQGLSPQLQALINMELRQNEQEKRMEAVETAQAQIKQAVGFLATPAPTKDAWQTEMNKQISTFCETFGLNHQATRSALYQELEESACVNLTARVSRMKDRLKREGARAVDCREVSKLTVVSADPKLRTAFTGIVQRRIAERTALAGKENA